MNEKNRVLVVVDPTKDDEQACVARGAWIAEKLDLGMDLLICDYEPFLAGDRVIDTKALKQLRKNMVHSNWEKLENIAKPLRENGLDIVTSSLWDTPLDHAIVRHVIRTNPKLVVKETHHHGRIGRTLLRNTDWNLVRLCPEPLWLAKQTLWPTAGTIVACVDPTHEHDKYAELDDQILNPAAMLAEKLGCELHAFHSYVPITDLPVMQMEPRGFAIDGVNEEMQASHQKRVDKLLEGYPVAKKNVHLLAGATDRVLPDLAREINAGLVVMGAIARNALQRVFIGSTAEKVLDRLPCDLLVVKPLWFKCPIAEREPQHSEGSAMNHGIKTDGSKATP